MNWQEVEKKLTGIEHQFTPSLARILFEHAQSLPDGAAILEIGAYKGYTTCALAYGCAGTNKRVWTIDNFCGNPANTDEEGATSYFHQFLKNIEARDLFGYIAPLVGRSEDFYAEWQRPLDLLFIDGNHAPAIVQGDVEAFFPWLKPGGWLFMHDVYPEPKPVNVNPTWIGIALKLVNCQYNLNLAWGRKA